MLTTAGWIASLLADAQVLLDTLAHLDLNDTLEQLANMLGMVRSLSVVSTEREAKCEAFFGASVAKNCVRHASALAAHDYVSALKLGVERGLVKMWNDWDSYNSHERIKVLDKFADISRLVGDPIFAQQIGVLRALVLSLIHAEALSLKWSQCDTNDAVFISDERLRFFSPARVSLKVMTDYIQDETKVFGLFKKDVARDALHLTASSTACRTS